MRYIKKELSSWEIKYGQIRIGEYEIAKEIFKDYIGTTFSLVTFKGNFPNRNFLHYEESRTLRLSCRSFFRELKEGDIIYILPINHDNIGIYNVEPIERIEEIVEDQSKIDIIKKAEPEIIRLLIDLIKENKSLRKENEYLMGFKEQLERFQSLQFIFDDEKMMEDWLERNIHRAVPDLEIIDRQVYLNWNQTFMRNKADLFCLDKTTRELVVIENKVRGRHLTVDTQFLKYRTWIIDNLDVIRTRYIEKNIKPSENFKFIIITDTTDERLERLCEVNKIGLVFIEGGVNIQEIVPYSSL